VAALEIVSLLLVVVVVAVVVEVIVVVVVVRPVVCQSHVNSQLSYRDENDHSIHIPPNGNKRRLSPCGNNSFFS
jgi:hypothetical protein